MAAAALPSRTANIVVPSIHLGSFSPYPAMSTDLKHPVRFPEENTIPVFRDEKSSSFPPQRSPSQWRPAAVSYPNQSYSYSSYSPNRGPYPPATPPPRTPPPGTALYPSILQGQSPVLPVQQPSSPAQLPGPPREVCVECMMRDEDMADVDVTSPGVWDRESDVLYHELCTREEDEEREKEYSIHRGTSSTACSSSSDPRPRARGGKLTEGNIKVWLTLNPREPTSKQQTLNTYLDAQNALLAAESKARLQAIQESRQLDSKMRDAYSELRRSAYDLGASASALDDGGVKIRSPSGGSAADDTKHKRDTTLLENGMIVERVDVRKEEARIRKGERRARKASRDSLSVVDNRDRERDATSLYSFQAAEGPASLRAAAPYESTTSVPMPTSRSVRSMYTTPSTSWQPPLPNRPLSMMPGSGSIPGFASQTSLDTMGSPRRRFFGLKHWSGYFSSNTSLAPSGSMVDMHLGLDQEKHLAQAPHVDIGSNAPSLREAWPRMDDRNSPARPPSDRASSIMKKKKRRGLGRLWKIITGGPHKVHERPRSDHGPAHEDEDEDLPLAPPPPLSYLVNRGGAQSERAVNMGPPRHVSMPSLTSSNGPHHPRSSSAPSGICLNLSSPSEQSSLLPSPTEVRFPYRDSSGDEPEDDDGSGGDLSGKKWIGGTSPPRPLVANLSEPEVRRPSPIPLSVPGQPMARGVPSSASLVPTIKVPRPASIMSLDKNLPPLPSGEHELPLDPPRGSGVPSATLPMAGHPHYGLGAPSPGFRSEDAARRQSFSGIASRPALPRGAGHANGNPLGPGMRYDDFGASRHSLAAFESVPGSTGAKRRSRFGIGALLGRKEKTIVEHHRRDTSAMSMPMSGSHEISYDAFVGTKSVSEWSSQQGVHNPRRPLDELVPQDSDFIAYRYPSRDERLDLSRG